MAHPYLRVERERALVAAAHHLHHLLQVVRVVRELNAHHMLELEVPSEAQVLRAIEQCEEVRRGLIA